MEKWRPSSAESCGAEIHMAKTRSRSPATDPLSFHFPISISLRLQCSTAKKQYQRTHTLRRPDANCCSSRSPVSTFHLNRTDRITKPNQQHDLYYIHTILQASTTTTAHSDRRPRNRRPDIITTASPTNRADQHGKHLSGSRKHILRNAGFCQPRLLLLVRAQVFRL